MVIDFQVEAIASTFTDIHLNTADVSKSVMFPGPQKAPGTLLAYLTALAGMVNECAQKTTRDHFITTVGTMSYRTQRVNTDFWALRLNSNEVPKFEKLGIRQVHQKLMLDPELKKKGGLILISGSPGSGKSTTAAALVAGRLESLGGYAVTVEDPPEFSALSAWHGGGYCEQRDVSESGYGTALFETLRTFPSKDASILFVGEVRDAATAAELCRIAVDGHLVISTIHAKDHVAAIQRMLSLANAGGEPEARQLLANSLRLIVHQRLDSGSLQMSCLKFDAPTAAIVQNGNLDHLREAVMRTEQRAAVSGLSM